MIDGEILEVKQKMQASFRRLRGLGYLTVPEMLATMHENDLFDMSPVFCNAVHLVHILGVIPATLCSVVSKTKHSKTKTEARSTQSSKTKHPKFENEAPKFENEAPKTRKRSTQNSKTKHPSSKTKHPKLENEAPKTRNHCRLYVLVGRRSSNR